MQLRGIHFTLNGRTNQYPRLLQQVEDPEAMKAWVLGKDEFSSNRIAIVVERPDTPEAHMHCLVEAGSELWKASKPTEGLKRWMKDKWVEFPKEWRASEKSSSMFVKPMVGTQTMEKMFGGYLSKESHIVVFQQGWDEEMLSQGKADYLVESSKKAQDLYETTYMQKALAYAKATDYIGDDLWEVLADMEGNGYSVAPLLAKRKISMDAVRYFAKKLRGGFSPDDLRDLLGAQDTQPVELPALFSFEPNAPSSSPK